MDQSEAKRLAALKALDLLPSDGVIGLGTGSTVRYFIEGAAERARDGRRWSFVPTSQASRTLGQALGLRMLDDVGPWDIDVCVDGADEVSDTLDLIKGGGACHAREKIVNYCSRHNVIIVDATKLSRRLGEKFPIPVEVLTFGHASTARLLERYGSPILRVREGTPVVTDSGHFIYDLKVAPIDDPNELLRDLASLPGVVEVGLFCGRADRVIVAGPDGVRMIER
jgi:ribose 5-phosphate isomerase A